MVLTYDAYSGTLENQKEKESEVQILKQKYEQDMKSMREEIKYEMRQQMSQLITRLKPEIVKQGLS
jgi:F0F1-type ATP synthase membrane subunit b/b'